MTKKVILITRPAADIDYFSQKLNEKNYTTLSCPMLDIQNLAAPRDLNPNAYDALIFTSRNAVTSLFKQTPNINKDIQIFCVGAATENALKNLGFTNIYYPDTLNAAELAHKIKSFAKKNKSYLYIRGEQISTDIKKTIEQDTSAQVHEAVLYESLQLNSFNTDIQQSFTEGNIDYVTLFSERTASAFKHAIQNLNLNRTLTNTKCLCFSDKVLCSVSDLNWQSTHTCNKPTLDSMLELIDQIDNLRP